MAEQGTDEWHLDRSGCATASGFADIIAVSKKDGSPLKARNDYLWRLATERVYGSPTESINAKSMEWGKDLEPFARRAYEIEKGAIVDETGFIPHPTIEFCGGSPDGLVGIDGGIEIKCPKARRIPMLIAICLERKDLGQGNMEMLIAGSSFLTESVKPPQPMLAAASILGIPGFENILIPNYEIVENVAVH